MKHYEVFAGGVRIGTMPEHQYAAICKTARGTARLRERQIATGVIAAGRTLGRIFSHVPSILFWLAVACVALDPVGANLAALEAVRHPAGMVETLGRLLPDALMFSASLVIFGRGLVGWVDVLDREINTAVRQAMGVPYPVDIEMRVSGSLAAIHGGRS